MSKAREEAHEVVGEERIRRVLDVAAQLAEDGGPEAVRMRDIAARAEMALGTLYKHFAGKDEVLIALLEREVDLLESSMAWLRASGDTYVKRAKSFFDPVTRILHSRRDQTRALLCAVATATGELTERIGRFHERTTALIVRVLAGTEPPRAEPRTLTPDELERLAYMLSQTWFAALIGCTSGLFGPEKAAEHVEAAATWLVRGALAS